MQSYSLSNTINIHAELRYSVTLELWKNLLLFVDFVKRGESGSRRRRAPIPLDLSADTCYYSAGKWLNNHHNCTCSSGCTRGFSFLVRARNPSDARR
jgi:hypothetical protein